MSEGFYLALVAAVGASVAVIPAIILAVAQLARIKQLASSQQQLKEEMNGHMSKVLEIQAVGKIAEGKLQGLAAAAEEALTAKTREEVREDAKAEVLVSKIKKDVGPDERADVKIGRKPAAAKEQKKESK